MTELPLTDMRILAQVINLPGPLAAHRLRELGADVTFVEPPGGNPLEYVLPAWYAALTAGCERRRLDLKNGDQRATFDEMLAEHDAYLTATRPAALARLGLDWSSLHARHPLLVNVVITGYPGPESDRPGHDLTYQAEHGLLEPPSMPRTLGADILGAERAVSETLAGLLGRALTGDGVYREAPLSEAARELAEPLRRGATTPGGMLAGGLAGYGIYPAAEGHVAVALLEPHLAQRFLTAAGIEAIDRDTLHALFAQRSAAEWERWAREHGLPLAALASSEADDASSPYG